MAAKAFLIICAQAFLMKNVYSQCAGGLGAPWGLAGPAGWNGLGGPGLAGPYGAGCGCGGVASTGGGLPVTSSSPIAPIGVSVISENVYEGALSAGGNLPFLGTVSVDGVLTTAGAGAVSYGCGNDVIGIVSEGPIATGILGPDVFAPAAGLVGPAGIAGVGYNGIGGLGYNGLGYGLGGIGCGGLI